MKLSKPPRKRSLLEYPPHEENPYPSKPLRFGQSDALKEWQDREETLELRDKCRERGLVLLLEEDRAELHQAILKLCSEDYEPDPGDVLRPFYEAIHDEDGELRETLNAEEVTNAYTAVSGALSMIQDKFLPLLEQPDTALW